MRDDHRHLLLGLKPKKTEAQGKHNWLLAKDCCAGTISMLFALKA